MTIRDPNYAENWKEAPEILALSAHSKQELKGNLDETIAALKSMGPAQLGIMAADSRASFSSSQPFRLLWVLADDFENLPDIIVKTNSEMDNQSSSSWATKFAFYGEGDLPGRPAFVFPGQGSQYPFMGQELMQFFPEIKQSLAAMDKIFDPGKKLTDYIYPQSTGEKNEKKEFDAKIRSTDIAQPAIGVISAAMLKILDSFGIRPDATCGHSFGELTALFASGRFDENTFYALSRDRGQLMAAAGGQGDKGGMLAVKAPLDQIDELIQASGLDVILANRNSPDQGVLSGPTDAIHQMQEICKDNKIRAVILPVSAAFHSRLVKEAAGPFQEILTGIKFTQSHVPVYSNTTGAPYPDDVDTAKAILGRHLLNPVHFIDEIQAMYKAGHRIYIEVGPRTVLTGLVKVILKDQPVHAVAFDASSGRRSAIIDFAKLLCTLSSLGYPVQLSKWKFQNI